MRRTQRRYIPYDAFLPWMCQLLNKELNYPSDVGYKPKYVVEFLKSWARRGIFYARESEYVFHFHPPSSSSRQSLYLQTPGILAGGNPDLVVRYDHPQTFPTLSNREYGEPAFSLPPASRKKILFHLQAVEEVMARNVFQIDFGTTKRTTEMALYDRFFLTEAKPKSVPGPAGSKLSKMLTKMKTGKVYELEGREKWGNSRAQFHMFLRWMSSGEGGSFMRMYLDGGIEWR